jgi:capsular polysaccharide biosynthesis protein
MSIQGQIKLFSETKFVIAPHGGAITNLLYSSDASLLEILPLERINRCFEWQSLVCGHRYSAIFHSQKTSIDIETLNSKIED